MTDHPQRNGNMGGRSALQSRDILVPHDHDVLSGRGNFVNYHVGNEYFRALVREHKVAYVACPKPQKGKFSRLIVDQIRARDPPGRFLKQDAHTKLWQEIGDKKALDKTRQALREGAPDLLKELGGSDEEGEAEPEESSESVYVSSDQKNSFGIEAMNLPYASSGLVGTQVSMPVPSVAASSNNAMQIPSGANIQRRVVPGMYSLSHHMTGTAESHFIQDDVDAVEKQLAARYSPHHFEPTPIHPNLLMKPRENYGAASPAIKPVSTAPLRRGIERSDSLEMDGVFKGEKEPKFARSLDEMSQQFSGMSFSIGDMTDEASNLSAVFEDDSLRNQEKFEERNRSKSSRMTSLSLGLDMSLASFSESAVMGSSLMMSSSRVFEEPDIP